MRGDEVHVLGRPQELHELPQQLRVEMNLGFLDADDVVFVHHQRAAHDDKFVDASAIMGEWEANASIFRMISSSSG